MRVLIPLNRQRPPSRSARGRTPAEAERGQDSPRATGALGLARRPPPEGLVPEDADFLRQLPVAVVQKWLLHRQRAPPRRPRLRRGPVSPLLQPGTIPGWIIPVPPR